MEHTYLRTNGIRLHVMQAGPPDGPLVILLHGFPEFWYGWRRQVEPLVQAGFRVLVPDQRGYNLSDAPAGIAAYRLGELVADVTGLIDAQGQEKVYLAGHDWGGIGAWSLALWRPRRVERLAILNGPHPVVMMRALQSNPRQILRSLYALFFQTPRLPEALLRNNDWELVEAAMVRSANAGSFTAADLEQYRRAWWRPGAFTAMLNWYRAALRYPPSFPHPRLSLPTLVLWGLRDAALGRELVQPCLDLCDRGEAVFFENASHWVQHDEAEAVSRALVAFFHS